MVRLIFATIAVPIVLAKCYDWIIRKEKVDFKTAILVLIATVAAVQVFYDRFFIETVEN